MPSILLYDPYIWKIVAEEDKLTIYCNGEVFVPTAGEEIFLYGFNPKLGDKKEYIKLVEEEAS